MFVICYEPNNDINAVIKSEVLKTSFVAKYIFYIFFFRNFNFDSKAERQLFRDWSVIYFWMQLLRQPINEKEERVNICVTFISDHFFDFNELKLKICS
jgi:hypothetical protein